MNKERDIQRAIIDYLELKKILFIRNNSGAFKTDWGFYKFGKKGSPDIVAVQKGTGRFIGIECKAKGKYQTKEQKEFQRLLEKDGGLYILARSLDDVILKI